MSDQFSHEVDFLFGETVFSVAFSKFLGNLDFVIADETGSELGGGVSLLHSNSPSRGRSRPNIHV